MRIGTDQLFSLFMRDHSDTQDAYPHQKWDAFALSESYFRQATTERLGGAISHVFTTTTPPPGIPVLEDAELVAGFVGHAFG